MEYITKPIRNDHYYIYGKNNNYKNEMNRILIGNKDKPIKTRIFLNQTEDIMSNNLIYQKENKNEVNNKNIYNSVKPPVYNREQVKQNRPQSHTDKIKYSQNIYNKSNIIINNTRTYN